MGNEASVSRGELARAEASPAAPAQGRSAAERRVRFEEHEALEMSASRRLLWRQALPWAWRPAIPAALVGWSLSHALVPISTQLSPAWTRPGAATALLLGAVCGGLGGAIISLLVHSVFTEDRDIPVVLGSSAALGVLAGGLHGAGLGSPLALAAGMGLGLPAGLAGGTLVLVVYSTLRLLAAWVREQLRR